MATSMRRSVTGSGTVTISSTSGRTKLIFSVSQPFLRGTAIYAVASDGAGGFITVRYTIDRGGDKVWYGVQPLSGYAASATSFHNTDRSTAKVRGWTGSNYADLIPRAIHYLYVSALNSSGVADWYTYVDTVRPVRGLHPYTGDRFTGQSWVAKDDVPENAGVMVPDVANRVAALDSLPPTLSA